MQDFTKRRGKRDLVRRFMIGACFVFFLALVAFGAARAAWGMYDKFAEAASANDAAQQNLSRLKIQRANVEAEVEALSSSHGQEAQLRQSYGVALPGEGEIKLVRKAASSTPEEGAAKGSFFVRIIKALFIW